MLCMRKQAHGHHVKEEKLAISAIQSMLSFLIPWLVRKMPKLVFGRKFFRARLCSKCAIVRVGTGYPSKRGSMGGIILE